MKKLAVILLSLMFVFSIVACNNNNNQNNNSSQSSIENNDSSSNQGISSVGGTSSSSPTYDGTMPTAPSIDFENANNTVIYLAGDSTVKTYGENVFIGGWGQFMHLFISGNTFVSNNAEGGRSTRSFINEGRLFTNTEVTTTKYQSIESTIKEGDYLLIQFGHNDDASAKEVDANYLDRKVPLGEPDDQGIFPTVIPDKVSTNELPADYITYLERLYQGDTLEQVITNNLNTIKKNYGSEYYSYDCGGTYKGYLKMYIDFAREKGAIPVLCTPVARVKFNSDGTLKSGANLHGENFAYVEAVRQLAEEENCLLIDTFEFTKNLLETVTKDYADYLMALKDNGITGKWAYDYDFQLDATGADKKWTAIEGTHYNRFGAYVTAAYVAETLNGFAEKEKITFGEDLSIVPSFFVSCPSHLEPKLDAIKSLFTKAQITK